ncbi:MAG: extracellular solute-binding protein [Angelakisella sp.]
MMKKRVISVALSIAMVASLCMVGCGAKEAPKASEPAAGTSSQSQSESKSEAPAKKEDVTIRFGIEKTQEAMFKEFEAENPGIKLEMVETGSETEKLTAMLAAGTAPDLIRVTGVISIPTYVTRGIALNLDPYFAKSEVFKADDLLPICDVYRFDGMKAGSGPLYGLPKDWSQDTGMVINKKVFRDRGVEIPSDEKALTYTQLIELSKKLRIVDDKGNVTQRGFDTEAFGSCGLNYKTLLYQLECLGSSLFTDDMSASRWTAPEVKKLVAEWVDARKNMYIGSPLVDATGMGGITDDQLAGENWGYWATGMYRGDDKSKSRLAEDFMLIPSPYPEGGKQAAACLYATGGIINSKTKHPDEAWKVFEWFFGGKPAQDRAKGGWGLPVLKSLMPLVPQTEAFDKQALKVVNRDNDCLVTLKCNPYAADLQTLIDKELIPVIMGKVELDAALKTLEEATNTRIIEGMEVAGVK